MRMDVSAWIALALLVVVVVATVVAVMVEVQFPVVSWIARWCNVARCRGIASPSYPLV